LSPQPEPVQNGREGDSADDDEGVHGSLSFDLAAKMDLARSPHVGFLVLGHLVAQWPDW